MKSEKTVQDDLDSYNGSEQTIRENEGIYGNKLIQSFLKTAEHRELLKASIHQETREAEEALDNAFREHYAEVRLISMFSNNLRRSAIRHDQKRNRESQRQLLILDQPVTDEGDTVTTNLDLVEDPQAIPIDQAVIERENQLENKIENPVLYHAICSLTTRQKHILESSYLFDMTDTEIAAKKNISQQSVTETRNKALSKLRKQLMEWVEHE